MYSFTVCRQARRSSTQSRLRFPNRFYWWNPWLRERQLPAHGYPRYSTHAVAQCLKLAQEVRHAAAEAPPRAAQIVVAINTRESTLNNRVSCNLVRAWQRFGSDVHLERLSGLPFTHDIIEPKRRPEVASRLAPRLVDLIDSGVP